MKLLFFFPWLILESFFSPLFINVMNSVAGGQEDYGLTGTKMGYGLLNVPRFRVVFETREQALVKEAIALCLGTEKGLPLTIETQQIEVAA